MSEGLSSIRIKKVLTEFNLGLSTVLEFLSRKGFHVESNPNAKITQEMYDLLVKEFQSEKTAKEESKKIGFPFIKKESVVLDETKTVDKKEIENEADELIIKDPSLVKKTEKIFKDEDHSLKAPKILGKIELPDTTPKPKTKPVKEEKAETSEKEKEEKKIEKPFVEKAEEKHLKAKEQDVSKTKKTEEPEKVKEEDKISEKTKPAEKPEKQPKEVSEDAFFRADTETENKIKVVGKIDLDTMNTKTKPDKKTKEEKKTERQKDKKETPKVIQEPVAEVTTPEPEIIEPEVEKVPEITKRDETPDNFMKTEFRKLEGPTILGKMILPQAKEHVKKPVASSSDESKSKKKKRKRIQKDQKAVDTSLQPKGPGQQTPTPAGGRPPQHGTERPKFKDKKHHKKEVEKVAPTEEEIQKQIKETLARLSGGTGKSKASKYRRLKRENVSHQMQSDLERNEEDKKTIKVTEFVTASELATMMNVGVTEIISTCMNLGLFVSINQRMDAETLTIIADEFGYKVEFVSVDVQEAIREEEDKPEDLVFRSPVVTVMGHVDHGKTSLLDYIRKANVIAGEAGGITQHVGAYEVKLENGKKITFLDTPGHEAFTAMRARGAKITDIVIVVVSADDSVMPQTIEAINHASAAGVPIIFAINKIDKPGANPEKIKEQLANLNYLVEDWGGKFQSQEISAKKGVNVDILLEKILLEAELLDLKANPNRMAYGAVIESSLDKGKGYVAKMLVQNGTLKIGDMVLAGCTYGKVKAMFNERNVSITSAGPSVPILLLGLNGAPQAGDKFNVMESEHEVKNIATKRLQLQREQGIRTQKHITLDEIGRRIAIGDFKELNVIVKGDVDGSIEALTDSILKLSTTEVQVNVIHKSVGQITESDVLLASASNAVIIGFQVRPSANARKLAENEQIDIRLYSIIYSAINELKSAIEGMLSPEIIEKIVCNIEIRDVFHVTKVGTIAGCYVLDGKVNRNTRIRLIRDGIVLHSGSLGSLKRFKDDVREVSAGYECGLNIQNFNDIKIGDIIEGYEETEKKRTL
jgi:translation initiation factor IF-2